MSEENTEIKEFEYYIVFMDDHDTYLTAYGYERKPAVLEFKYALETLAQDEELAAAIPDFTTIIDFICFEVMNHKRFIKYMTKQEEKAAKAEAKAEKKSKKKKKAND